ncbi:MAG: hypothetical protein KY469_16730 [Actinobacteria bacterium]|nr:hypothetical protein [Actinomycetota bacterium]
MSRNIIRYRHGLERDGDSAVYKDYFYDKVVEATPQFGGAFPGITDEDHAAHKTEKFRITAQKDGLWRVWGELFVENRGKARDSC